MSYKKQLQQIILYQFSFYPVQNEKEHWKY